MILKMINTDRGDVLIDNIEQITTVGVTKDQGDTIHEIYLGKIVMNKYMEKENVLYDILSHYNLSPILEYMYVFNLVIRSRTDNKKEFRSVIFKGPGFLMNDTGYTMETYNIQLLSQINNC